MLPASGYSVTRNTISLADSLTGFAEGRGNASGGSSLRERAKWVQSLSLDDVMCPQGGNVVLPMMTPSPCCVHRGHSLPHLLGRTCGPTGAAVAPGDACNPLGHCKAPLVAATGSAAAQGAAALSTELRSTTPSTPTISADLLPAPALPPAPARPMLTPCTLDSFGFSVQNTFIHAALPPPTPPAGAAGRARSLPRNMGARERAELHETVPALDRSTSSVDAEATESCCGAGEHEQGAEGWGCVEPCPVSAR